MVIPPPSGSVAGELVGAPTIQWTTGNMDWWDFAVRADKKTPWQAKRKVLSGS